MLRFTLLVLSALIVILPVNSGFAASSQTASNQPAISDAISVSANLGLISFDGQSKRGIGSISGLRLGYEVFGKEMFDSLGFELGMDVATTGHKTGSNSGNSYLVRAEGFYPVLLTGNSLIPSFVIGIGGMLSPSSKDFFFGYGANLKYYLFDFLALRTDARQIFAYRDISLHSNIEFTVGVTYLFSYDKNLKRVPPVLQSEPLEKPKESTALPTQTELH